MKAAPDKLCSTGSTFKEQQPSARGYFKLTHSSSKVTLKLRGDFNRDNIDCIKALLKTTKLLCRNCFEIDLNEANTISMQAMALLAINLKKLKEKGIYTNVIGLKEGKLKMAHDLGMHFITQIN